MNSPDAGQNGVRYVGAHRRQMTECHYVLLLGTQVLLYGVGGIIAPFVGIRVVDIMLKGIVS
jgi:high-affinity K+ transport system ATPase subunit B